MNIKDKFLYFMGNWRCFKFPFHLVYGAQSYKLTKRYGVCIPRLEQFICPGDIIFRRYDDYSSTFFIGLGTGGFWTHTGICIGDGKVIHALKDGVIIEDIRNFCNCDHVALKRYNYTEERIEKIVAKAKGMVGRPYDFNFDTKTQDKLYCSELIYALLGKGELPNDGGMISPQEVFDDNESYLVFDSRNE